MQPPPLGTSLHVHARRPWPHDTVCMGMIVMLALILMPSLGIRWLDFWPPSVDPDRAAHVQGVFNDIVSRLASFYLLPAMGMLLALRRRAIDLSVWTVAGLGGVVGAAIINMGGGPVLSLVGAIATGLTVGAVNAGAVMATKRVPTWLITLATSAIALWTAQAIAGARTLEMPQGAFDQWRLMPYVNLTRMLMVAAIYSLTMVSLIGWEWALRRRTKHSPFSSHGSGNPRRRAATGLVVSSVLAAVGGMVWIVEHSSAPVPTRLIGDLRIPAAAVLAGAVMLVGPGRSLLAGLFLPVSLLLVTIWRQEVRPWQWLHARGYAFQLAELTAMVLTVQGAFHASFKATTPAKRRFMAICGIKAIVAVGIVAFQVTRQGYQARQAWHFVGIVVWLHAMGALSLPSIRRWILLAWARLRRSDEE